MAQVELFSSSRCSSCRETETLLARRGVRVAKRDLFAEPLSPTEIGDLFARIGTTPREMLAMRSRPYRQLGLAQRDLTDDEVVALMANHPALIRRPIVVAGGEGQAGFNRAAIERLVAAVNDGGNEDA